MSDSPNRILEVCNSRYQEIFGQYKSASDKQVVVSHFGDFSQELVNNITTDVESIMVEAGDKRGIIKRVFSILIEGLQNIRLHGEHDEDDNQASFLIVARDDETYAITFANLVYNINVKEIGERIELINTMDPAKLKEHYMEILTNGMISTKGGAGLGFITVAMKSKNKLNYKFTPIDDEISCFTVDVVVDRIKK